MFIFHSLTDRNIVFCLKALLHQTIRLIRLSDYQTIRLSDYGEIFVSLYNHYFPSSGKHRDILVALLILSRKLSKSLTKMKFIKEWELWLDVVDFSTKYSCIYIIYIKFIILLWLYAFYPLCLSWLYPFIFLLQTSEFEFRPKLCTHSGSTTDHPTKNLIYEVDI